MKFLKSYKLFENDLADQYRNWKQKNEEDDIVEPEVINSVPAYDHNEGGVDNSRYESEFGGKPYYWECDTIGSIPEKHIEALKEDAEERILYYLQEGYHSGELNTSVRYGQDKVPEEDPEEGLSYSGWWG